MIKQSACSALVKFAGEKKKRGGLGAHFTGSENILPEDPTFAQHLISNVGGMAVPTGITMPALYALQAPEGRGAQTFLNTLLGSMGGVALGAAPGVVLGGLGAFKESPGLIGLGSTLAGLGAIYGGMRGTASGALKGYRGKSIFEDADS